MTPLLLGLVLNDNYCPSNDKSRVPRANLCVPQRRTTHKLSFSAVINQRLGAISDT